jgi:hypothetical protein
VAAPEPYHLVSTWRLRAPVPVVWELLADPAFTWHRWWPLLRTDVVRAHADPDGRAVPGAGVTLRVRSPASRALRVRLTLTAVTPPACHPVPAPGHARFTADGDLVGTACVVVRPVPCGSVVALRWEVTPAAERPGLAAHRRLSTAAHSAVMRVGEAGLRHRLRRRSASPCADSRQSALTDRLLR